MCELHNLILPNKFQVSWPFGSGEEFQNTCRFFKMAATLDFIGSILTIFDLQVTLILPTKFWVNWPLSSEVQNRFSWWRPLRPFWNTNDFSYFGSASHPGTSNQVSISWPSDSEEAQNVFFCCFFSLSIFRYVHQSRSIIAILVGSPLDYIPMKFDWNWPRGVGVVI